MIPIPPYPDSLKNSAWQKHKGIIAKIWKKETGIGEALTQCEKLHKDLVALASKHDPKAPLDGPLKNAVSMFGLQCMDVESDAAKAAKDWSGKLCPVPKDTRLYAEKIAAAAKQYKTAVTTILKG